MKMNFETTTNNNIWEEKKEKKLESLEKKAKIFVDVWNLTKEVSAEDSKETVERKLTEWETKSFSEFDEKTRKGMREIFEIKERLRPIKHTVRSYEMEKNEIIESLLEEGVDFEEAYNRYQEDPEEIKLLVEEGTSLEERIEKITDENPEVVFLNAVVDIKENLLLKNTWIKNAVREPFIREHFINNEKYKETDVKIELDAFSVSLIVNPGVFKKFHKPGVVGIHIDRTPFIEVSNNEGVEDSLYHEKIHNILDGLEEYIGDIRNPKDLFQSFLKRLQNLKRINAPSVIIENQENSLKRLAKNFLRYIREELLTELKGIEERTQRRVLEKNKSEKEKSLDKVSSRLMMQIFGKEEYNKTKHHISSEDIISNYTTAGKITRETLRYLYAFIKENESMSSFVRDLCTIIEEEISTFGNAAREAIAVSREFGNEEFLQTHALIFMLEPKKIHHVKNYLQNKYSEKEYEKMKKRAMRKGIL